MISAKVKIPKFSFEIQNESEVVEWMATVIAARSRDRLGRGAGPDGALPAPKDGGAPLRRTGSLVRSIGVVMRQRRGRSGAGRSVGVVRALGPRPAAENVAGKKRAARAKTRQLRAAAVLGAFIQETSGAGIRGNSLKKRGKGIRTAKIRVRAAVDNAALVAILANPPRDLRSRNGGRKIYTILGANELDQAAAARAAQAVAQPSLPARGFLVVGG